MAIEKTPLPFKVAGFFIEYVKASVNLTLKS
jgi:hypothetical protein